MNNIINIIQINPTVGNCKGNFDKLVTAINSIKQSDLIILSSFSMLGFPYFDLIKKYPWIINQQKDYIKKLANTDKTIITNFTDIKNNKEITKYALIQNNKFSEITNRNNIIKINKERFQLETLINIGSEFELKIKLKKDTDSLILFDNCNSINGKEYLKNKKLSEFAKKNKITIYYVNQYGSTDCYSFDGASRIYDKNGDLKTLAKSFNFDIINSSETRKEPLPKGAEKKFEKNKKFTLNYENDLERTYLSIKQSIQDYFYKNGFSKAVLGLSGGLDSTISAVILTDALGKENVLGVSMPSKLSSKSSKDDAEILAKNLGIEYLTIPISEITETTQNLFNNTFDKISNKFKPTTQNYVNDNIQARARATILWGISNKYNSTFTIATSDKSELYMGYATINGDMSGSFAPLADITKTKLFALGYWLNKNRKIKNAIPQSILEKSPGAELAINPKTGKLLLAEEALMPYEFMDEVIFRVENQNQDFETMLNDKFLYEKNNKITKELKKEWLNKFFRRTFTSTYKSYILPPTIIIEPRTINKHHQPISCKINL